VVGSGPSAESQIVYINRGADDGIAQNMPVITPDGVVGKITAVFKGTAQVLLITDPDSGVGALVESTRVHGSLRGSRPALCELKFVVNEDDVPAGTPVVTSGEDQIYPKGLPLGVVTLSERGEMFRHIEVRPSAALSRLEEVLVVTRVVQRAPTAPETSPMLTAAQMREQHLPSVPDDPLFPKTGVPPAGWEIQEAERARRKKAAQQAATPGKPANASAVVSSGSQQTTPAAEAAHRPGKTAARTLQPVPPASEASPERAGSTPSTTQSTPTTGTTASARQPSGTASSPASQNSAAGQTGAAGHNQPPATSDSSGDTGQSDNPQPPHR
jgi:rod shape-determining protein MreC